MAEKRIVSAVAYFAGIFLNLRAWLELLKKSGNCFSQKLPSDLKKKDWIEQPIVLAYTKLKPATPSFWGHFRSEAYYMPKAKYIKEKCTFFTIQRNNMSLAGSIHMIFFSMSRLTCMIGSQGGPNKMAAANFLSL